MNTSKYFFNVFFSINDGLRIIENITIFYYGCYVDDTLQIPIQYTDKLLKQGVLRKKLTSDTLQGTEYT